MMRAAAFFRVKESGEVSALGPGEFIGRSEMAALFLDDPRISEAHAMVSLREGALKLLALRGRFRLGQEVLTEVTLREGMTLELAPGVEIVCDQVELPRMLLGVHFEGMPPLTLTGTMSVHAGPPPRLTRGYDPEGQAVLWSVGERWRVRARGQQPRGLAAGDVLEVGGLELEAIAVPLGQAAHTNTRSGLRAPLSLVCLSEVVRIERGGEPDVLVSGIPGKILAALLRRGLAASWREITASVWPGDASMESALRRRFDAGLSRLRAQLAHVSEAGEELITLDGTGLLVLQLGDQDRAEVDEDES